MRTISRLVETARATSKRLVTSFHGDQSGSNVRHLGVFATWVWQPKRQPAVFTMAA